MKKLLKQYNLNSDVQYFELIVKSFLNGQKAQAKEQFAAMPRQDKKNFIRHSVLYCNCGLNETEILETFLDLV